MIIFYSLGVFILLLVNHAVQQERGNNVLPGLMRVGKEGKEAWDQTRRNFKDEGLDNFLGTPV